jgi:hypothetical protein
MRWQAEIIYIYIYIYIYVNDKSYGLEKKIIIQILSRKTHVLRSILNEYICMQLPDTPNCVDIYFLYKKNKK